MPPRAWKILPAVGVLALWPSSAPAQSSAAAQKSYEDCAYTMAKHYASGPDAADLIARGAVDACLPQKRYLAQIMQQEGRPSNFILEAIEQAEADLIRQMKLQVLQFRVKK